MALHRQESKLPFKTPTPGGDEHAESRDDARARRDGGSSANHLRQGSGGQEGGSHRFGFRVPTADGQTQRFTRSPRSQRRFVNVLLRGLCGLGGLRDQP